MLRSLLFRDWLLNRFHLLMVLGIFVAFQIYFVLQVDSPRMWLVFTGIYLAFQTFVPFSREDKFRSAGWTCTLPVSRRDIVRARWAGAWLMIGAGVLLAGAMGLALPGSQIALAAALTPDTLLLAAAFATLILLLLLPFTIRFGILGLLIFLVGAQIVGAGLLVVAMVTGGGRGGAGQALHRLIEGSRGGLLSLQAALSEPLFHLMVLAALLLLNWLGYRFALALYRRREF